MTAWIESLNSHSALWSAWLWRVCWQGAIVIAIAWLLTMLLRRWSPRLRSWIWRLAYLKLLGLLVWTTPVTLAVLPAEQESGVSGQESSLAAGPAARSAPTDNVVLKDATSPFSRDPQGSDAQDSAVAATAGSPSIVDQGGNASVPLSLPSVLLLAWSLGLILVVAWLAYETWLAIRLRRSARLVSSPELEALVREVQTQLGTRGNVRLAESESVGGPMLVKFATPVVVFPTGMLPAPSPRHGESPAEPQPSLATASPKEPAKGEEAGQLSLEDLRLVLAHELAHVKRHDLAWNALAAVVHAPLYFHPLLWLAHRLARQEQEMACDELVVTHLGVARHEYGRMLVKIVKQMGNSVRTSVAVVGMASSYQTLSRRLKAMQNIRQFGRKQAIVAGCFIAIVGLISIVPWRLVAQEGAPKAAAPAETVEPTAEDSKPPAEANSSPAKSPEKLIVGVWRGGRDSEEKEIVFNEDGTYDDLGAKVYFGSRNRRLRSGQLNTQVEFMAGQGTWKQGDSFLALTNNDAASIWKRTEKVPEGGAFLPPASASYDVVRLDQEFLRIKLVGLGPNADNVFFFRRVAEKPIHERFAAIPPEYRAIAAAARLSPEEGIALVDWLKANNVNVSQLAFIERVIQARRQKLTLADVFGLKQEEVDALYDVVQQTNGDYERMTRLATTNQLSPEEQRALDKLKAFNDEVSKLLDAMPVDAPTYFREVIGRGQGPRSGRIRDIRRSIDGGLSLGPGREPLRGGGGPPRQAPATPVPALSEAQAAAFTKLNSYLGELGKWFWDTVFDVQ